MYRHAMRMFEKGNVHPEVTFRLDQLSTSCTLAASNNGACFVTDTVFRYHKFPDTLRLYNIKHSGTRTLYIAQKKNRYTTSAMKKFIEIAKETISPSIHLHNA